MKIQQKKDRELAEREGSAKTTVIQGIWLAISFVVAYFVVNYLDSSGLLTIRSIRGELNLPTYVPNWAVIAIIMLVFVIFTQAALALGFFFASPAGRRKSGKGDLQSRNKSLDDRY